MVAGLRSLDKSFKDADLNDGISFWCDAFQSLWLCFGKRVYMCICVEHLFVCIYNYILLRQEMKRKRE